MMVNVMSKSKMPNDLLSNLNSIQKEAVTYKDGPMLILAGAGSGKTRVLTYRIAWLIEQEIDPKEILAITFTNKAASEMKTRIIKLLQFPKDCDMPDMGTFHAMCVRILRRHSQQIGIPNNFVIYDETDSNALIKQAMEKLNISVKKFNPSSIKSTISSAKNEMVSAEDYKGYSHGYYQDIVASVYPVYEKLLRENQALDFDDLLIITYQLLKQNDQVLDFYQQKWKYILVDEYQDTNKVQYLLTKLLASKSRNINVVGDAAQSIYAFRGADLRNVTQFMKDYPDVKVFNLEQNYRSTQKILDTATAVISPNKASHPVLKLWTDNPAGEDIVIYEASDGDDEANFIVSEIEHGKRDFNNYAILYRTNAQSRIFEEALIRAGIPYQIIGGVRFYDRREIKDLISYLRLIINPKDSVSFERIVNTPPRGIGPVTLKQGGVALTQFEVIIDEFRKKYQELSVLALLDHVIEKIGFENYIHDGTEEGLARWENVQELRAVANEFDKLGPVESTLAFIESVSLLEQTDITKNEKELIQVTKPGEKPNRVTLMTLHAAKGLEFEVVFLVGLEEGLLPHMRSLDQKFDLEEERRLCYVGITRAKEQLFVSYARSRTVFGSFTANIPSRFLKEFPKEIIKFKQAAMLFDQISWNSSYDRKKYREPDPLNPWEI